jgi:NADPH-dependent 2,4-dienoyl-CoA reductase/sulfur reductase-like enzyme
MHFLIIGGSDAGIAAGLRAHELDPTCDITLVLADEYPNYSICGLPFFLSGETPDWRSLAHRTEFPGIRLMLSHTAESIDPISKSVVVRNGRTAGENAIGGNREFAGSLGTQVVKLFDLVIARTGLRHVEARNAGFDSFITETTAWDHKAYYPGAHELRLRVTGDRETDRLLGAQLLGHKDSEVSKRVDVFAAALYHGMQVEELNDLDLSYTPPPSSPWDPIQTGAQAWNKAVREESSSIALRA